MCDSLVGLPVYFFSKQCGGVIIYRITNPGNQFLTFKAKMLYWRFVSPILGVLRYGASRAVKLRSTKV